MPLFQKKDTPRSLYQHIAELRKLLIIFIVIFLILFVICFYYASNIFAFLSKPLIVALRNSHLTNKIIATDVTDVFSTYMKIAFNSSLILFLPLGLLITFAYLVGSLNKREKKLALVIVLLVPVLFVAGAAFSYYVIFTMAWNFFIKFTAHLNNVTLLPTVIAYTSMALKIIIAFGIAFQLPILLFILCYFDIINKKDILKFSRYYIVLAFILGAILTPPDPLSQLIVASAFLLLYYMSYFLVALVK